MLRTCFLAVGLLGLGGCFQSDPAEQLPVTTAPSQIGFYADLFGSVCLGNVETAFAGVQSRLSQRGGFLRTKQYGNQVYRDGRAIIAVEPAPAGGGKAICRVSLRLVDSGVIETDFQRVTGAYGFAPDGADVRVARDAGGAVATLQRSPISPTTDLVVRLGLTE